MISGRRQPKTEDGGHPRQTAERRRVQWLEDYHPRDQLLLAPMVLEPRDKTTTTTITRIQTDTIVHCIVSLAVAVLLSCSTHRKLWQLVAPPTKVAVGGKQAASQQSNSHELKQSLLNISPNHFAKCLISRVNQNEE